LGKIEEIDSSKEHVNPIITELREAVEFYPAEEYHQDYIKKNGRVCYHQLYVDNK
jgi:peptide methionine sulfoxide reductase MsrA